MPKKSGKKSFLLLTALVLVLTALGIYANAWKDKCKVAAVVVEGNRILADKEIVALAKVPMNTLLFDLDLFAIEQRVLQNEYMKSVAVHRDLPDRIRISVEERVPVAALLLEKLYYLDADGYVLPAVQSRHVFDLPVLTGVLDGREFSPGKPIRNKDVLEALRVLSLARQVDDDVFRNISEICVASGKDFVFYTAEFGVPVILGREEIGIQLVKFESFWKSVVARQGADRLQYIDLRFEDQVVVRWNHNDGDVHS